MSERYEIDPFEGFGSPPPSKPDGEWTAMKRSLLNPRRKPQKYGGNNPPVRLRKPPLPPAEGTR